MIAEKHSKPYSRTMHWIRCRLSFSLLRSAIICLRGSRSAPHRPAGMLITTDTMDVACSEGRVPNFVNLEHGTMWTCNTFYQPVYICQSVYYFQNSNVVHMPARTDIVAPRYFSIENNSLHLHLSCVSALFYGSTWKAFCHMAVINIMKIKIQ